MEEEKSYRSAVVAAADIALMIVQIFCMFHLTSAESSFSLWAGFVTHAALALGCFVLGIAYLVLNAQEGSKGRTMLTVMNAVQLFWVVGVYLIPEESRAGITEIIRDFVSMIVQ